MTLGSALQIGRSALFSTQAAIEVAGNNLANLATEGYHRQVIDLAPVRAGEIGDGLFIGRGVQIESITRQVNSALEARLQTSISDGAGTAELRDLLRQIEALENEFTETDLSTQLSAFFNSWSELANTPDSLSQRNVTIQNATSLAANIRDMDHGFRQLLVQVDDDIAAKVEAADAILTQIQDLNLRIIDAEHGTGSAHALRDQRDGLLQDLSQYLDISAVEQTSGAVDVFVGAQPLILNGRSRGLELNRTSNAGEPIEISLHIRADQSEINSTAGSLGALINARDEVMVSAIDVVNDFAGNLIFEVNRLHTQGQGINGFNEVTGAQVVQDSAAPLSDPAAGLPFTPEHGSFRIHLTDTANGQRETSTISIDLDGINAAADTTLDSLAAQIDAVDGISASVTTDGRLSLTSDSSNLEISFSDDTSGVLAALGINSFFTGSNANNIGVNSTVRNDPGVLAVGLGHVPGDNRTALAISDLRDAEIESLNGATLRDVWDNHVQDYAVRLGRAELQFDAHSIVRSNIESQIQSTSGVNADEEAINLLAYQRAYQGSARFLSVVDQLMQTLLQII